MDSSDFIARDTTRVYDGWHIITNADPNTFEMLGNGYFKDKSTGYYSFERTKPLKSGTSDELKVLGGGYARDIKYAYCFGRVIATCTSPMSFRAIPTVSGDAPFMAIDNERVYFERAELRGANPATWRYLEKGFSTDGRKVFMASKTLAGAVPSKWRIIEHHYSTDGHYIYWMEHKLKGADPETFEVLNPDLARDKNAIFEGGKIRLS